MTDKTPPPAPEDLSTAAQALLDAIDARHDSAESPQRYGVPYGAVNALRAALAAATPAPAVQFSDPRVQAVYALLCDDTHPPEGEHWEGWAARRIVDALAPAPAQAYWEHTYDGSCPDETQPTARDPQCRACRALGAAAPKIPSVVATDAVAEMEARKDAAYLERNQCVAALARMALALGCRAGIARTAIEGWSDDWHGCVYIDLPTGQVSWHFHDSQAALFAGLPPYASSWDGHDTPEKYRRVAEAFAAPPAPVAEHAEPWDMALCESRSLVLRVGQPYVFRPVDGCEKCAAMHQAAVESYGPDAGAPQAPQLVSHETQSVRHNAPCAAQPLHNAQAPQQAELSIAQIRQIAIDAGCDPDRDDGAIVVALVRGVERAIRTPGMAGAMRSYFHSRSAKDSPLNDA